MSRVLSQTATHSALAQTTTEAWLVLLTLSGGGLPAALRYVNNWEDVTSGGETFTAWPFEITLLSEEPDGVPQATLRIDNVDLALVTALRLLSEPVTATVAVILASQPDTVEVDFDFSLRAISYDAQTIEAVLAFEPIMDEPIPAHTFCPTYYPGLYSHVEAAGVAKEDDVQLGTGGAYYQRPKGSVTVPAKGRGGLAHRIPGAPKKEDK